MRSADETLTGYRNRALASASSRPRYRSLIICLTCAGAAIGLLALSPARAVYVWNFTASIPVGLYSVTSAAPKRGDILVIAPDETVRAVMRSAGIERTDRLLLKPFAAGEADLVCRDGQAVSINGTAAAMVRERTAAGRRLPYWSGCKQLGPDQVFVIAPHPDSLDSRYFGPLPANTVIGVASPVLTFPSRETS